MPKYQKLVRDNIPSIIESNDKVAITRTLNEEEYFSALKEKLLEEVNEYLLSPTSLEELADIEEVVISLAPYLGHDEEELEHIRKEKAFLNGSFYKRIFLEEVKESK